LRILSQREEIALEKAKLDSIAQSEPWLRRAVLGLEKLLSVTHPQAMRQRELLASMIAAQGRTAEADAVRQGNRIIELGPLAVEVESAADRWGQADEGRGSGAKKMQQKKAAAPTNRKERRALQGQQPPQASPQAPAAARVAAASPPKPPPAAAVGDRSEPARLARLHNALKAKQFGEGMGWGKLAQEQQATALKAIVRGSGGKLGIAYEKCMVQMGRAKEIQASGGGAAEVGGKNCTDEVLKMSRCFWQCSKCSFSENPQELSMPRSAISSIGCFGCGTSHPKVANYKGEKVLKEKELKVPQDGDKKAWEQYIEIRCVVCLSRPKTATLMHGAVGHTCVCMGCAQQLLDALRPCPLCREAFGSFVKERSQDWEKTGGGKSKGKAPKKGGAKKPPPRSR
jgi:E3 ubiquitin-protein ligase Mdm2